MTCPTVSLLLGVHNHQPVDNWDYVLEDATEKCYRPFLQVLEAHPGVRMSVHYTGYLLNWLAEHHPDLIERLKTMVQRGQVELFTGGMYEPVLSIIPDEDKVGQIKALTQRVKELFGVSPKGLWLAERVWEPHLVKYLHEAGVEYICLDDSHFKSVGLDDEELLGRYTSEDQGNTVDIFPISKQMRYLIPYAQPNEVIEYLKSIATPAGDRAAVYFDDGEKFGVWPGTYKSSYEEKWLDRFFQAIEDNQDVVKCQLYSEYVDEHPSFDRIYLPTASYSEMLEWALPAKHINALDDALHHAPEQYQRFLRGGFWRHFLAKYPESNNMHKKMLHVSRKVKLALAKDAQQGKRAQDHLWRGQSNDALWHGVFGGLYLTNLRFATYTHLLKAEALADAVLGTNTAVTLEQRDFDCDGEDEVLLETPSQNLYVTPSYGGAVFELDVREKSVNLLDTVARRYEAYHDKLSQAVLEGDDDGGEAKSIHDRVVAKESGLEDYLHYDWHRRLSLLDHFFSPDTTLDSLFTAQYGEQGDFVNQPYEVVKASGNTVVLERQGHVWCGEAHVPIQVRKTLTVDDTDATTTIDYELTNLSDDQATTLWFSPEFNVNLLAPDAPDRYYRIPEEHAENFSGEGDGSVAVATKPTVLKETHMTSKGALEHLPGIELVDEWLGLTYQLLFDKPTTVWRFPIHTVSQSEAGFEKIYQSSVLYPQWQFDLAPGESYNTRIQQRVLLH